jgi:hypothetical protein
MSTQSNSRPTRTGAPVIRHTPQVTTGTSGDLLRLLPAVVASTLVNGALFGLLFLVPSGLGKAEDAMEAVSTAPVDTKAVDKDQKKEEPALTTQDIDDEATDSDVEITNAIKRKEEVTVPGELNPNDPIGIPGAKDSQLTDINPAFGQGGGSGRGGEGLADGWAPSEGEMGGDRLGFGKSLAGTFYGRSGATKEDALLTGGGTKKTEAAKNRGLMWLARHQAANGSWSLSGFNRDGRCNCGNHGGHDYPIAATAFGVLPFLGNGNTHKLGTKKDPNPYEKVVKKALYYLMSKQKSTGNYGGNMYCHGLATIAMCEAFGLTQDPHLKRSAQMAVNYIVYAQDKKGGGWRYGPQQPGDTSVVGWQVMALKSAQMANLKVPEKTMRAAERFLDSVMSEDNYGYGYTAPGSTSTLTAVGLLCRQYLQGWGAGAPKMFKAVNSYLKTNMPVSGKNMYYYYYATQVMHHLGGDNWKDWNLKMREVLVNEQDQGKTPGHKHQEGSWSPEGDPHGGIGGRLMITSLSILTLEVYYRHLPLYSRDVMEKVAPK